MKNIFLEIEYDGSEYFGFQVQNHARAASPNTVQAELEKALFRLFNKRTRTICAGRTDKGVHACGQCVHFCVQTQIPLGNIKTALNSFLPDDIRVKRIQQVAPDFHARFSAVSKIYRYIISTRKEPSVFERKHSWHMSEPLSFDRLKKVCVALKGKRDFFPFARDAGGYKDCVRTIRKITIKKNGAYVYIDIEANGFLRNMARNIVSFAVDVARGKMTLSEAREIIGRKAAYKKHPAPACGLYLLRVMYE